MNNDFSQEILCELKKLRRLTQVSLYGMLAAFVLLAGYIAWTRHNAARSRFARALAEHSSQSAQQRATAGSETGDTWSQIEALLDRGNYAAALSLARDFTNRAPTDQFPYACLGRVYLAMGDITNAEAYALRAYELYPIEENEQALAAIRKRLAREQLGSPQAK